jgi:SAM-dependent methyltransferase
VTEFDAPSGVDPFTPSVARMYDYYLGGKDNFAADREAAEKIIEILPNVRDVARENRDFLIRTVTYLSGQGVQELAPEARVVYVDNDPIVLTHARALLAQNERVMVVGADMRGTQALLDHPDVRSHLDLSQPVAVLLLGVLHFIPDDDEAMKIVTTLRSILGPGGYLVVSHGSIGELSEDEKREGAQVFSRTSAPGVTSRSVEQVLAFFDGLDLVHPGVVPLQRWRPETHLSIVRSGEAGAVGGVARVS